MYKEILIGSLIIVALACQACSAATNITWDRGAGTDDWNTDLNWSTDTIPPNNSSYYAVVTMSAGPVISTGSTVGVYRILLNGPAGTLTVSGGTLNVGNHIYVGDVASSNGTMNVSSGTVAISGTLYISRDAGAVGTINLTGGSLTCSTLTMCSNGGTAGLINIEAGTLTIPNSGATYVSTYVSNGWIKAYNGTGTLIIDTTTVPGQTILSARYTYKALNPFPANNAANVDPGTSVSWKVGNGDLSHNIYFGTDANAVAAATTSTAGIYKGNQLRDANSYSPAGIALSTKYYWRIDEVNDTAITQGDVWQFTIADSALIDDFEKYAGSAAMSSAWSNASTGATLSLVASGGHDKPKAMKFDYNNGNTPLYSEAQIAGVNSNWTVAGVSAIDIWYKGSASNSAQPMYAALEDNNGHPVAVIVDSNSAAVQSPDWQVWRIRLADFAGVNLANVKKFYLGFGSRTNPVVGGSGTIYFDDIKLYPTRCLSTLPTDLNKDCVVDFDDFAVFAENWTR